MMVKNTLSLLAISMTMRMWGWNTARIAWCSMSRATLEATGLCHQASICTLLSQQPPWSSILAWKIGKASVQKAQNGPSIQLIKATSCIERSNVMIGAEDLSYFFCYQTLTQVFGQTMLNHPLKHMTSWLDSCPTANAKSGACGAKKSGLVSPDVNPGPSPLGTNVAWCGWVGCLNCYY